MISGGEWIPALLMVGIAGVWDLRKGIIPNWLTLPGLLLGFGWHFARSGWTGLLFALGGAVLMAVFFLIPYLLGGLGAGDLKLVLALGALLGPREGVQVALASAIAGGLLAIFLLLRRGGARTADGELHSGGLGKGDGTQRPQRWGRWGTMPYGVAIAIGTAWSVLVA